MLALVLYIITYCDVVDHPRTLNVFFTGMAAALNVFPSPDQVYLL